MVQAYSVKARQTVEIKDPHEVILKNGVPAITGTCPITGTKVYRFMKRKTDPVSILKMAVEREREAEDFYEKAGKTVDDRMARKMFNWLAREEDWHRISLSRQLKAVMERDAWETWKAERRPIADTDLPDLSEVAHTREATSYQHDTSDEVSALRTAIRAETKAAAFYRNNEQIMANPEGKKMFASFAQMEEGHLKLLSYQLKHFPKYNRIVALPRFIEAAEG
ncbi:MAG: ferritin family protein [Dehalococcoidia bacterium]|nr:ferritin family protein [Dehalococcoidia bacterium]